MHVGIYITQLKMFWEYFQPFESPSIHLRHWAMPRLLSNNCKQRQQERTIALANQCLQAAWHACKVPPQHTPKRLSQPSMGLCKRQVGSQVDAKSSRDQNTVYRPPEDAEKELCCHWPCCAIHRGLLNDPVGEYMSIATPATASRHCTSLA